VKSTQTYSSYLNNRDCKWVILILNEEIETYEVVRKSSKDVWEVIDSIDTHQKKFVSVNKRKALWVGTDITRSEYDNIEDCDLLDVLISLI